MYALEVTPLNGQSERGKLYVYESRYELNSRG